MFTALFSLLLCLLLINFVPEFVSEAPPFSPEVALGFGLLYGASVLAIIAIQNLALRRTSNGWYLLLVSSELLLFLFIYHYVLAAHRLYWCQSQFLLAAVSLGFYFLGLWVYYRTHVRETLRIQAGQRLRFLCPFVLPFFVFDLLLDGERIFHPNSPILITFLSGSVLIGVLVLFFPYVIHKMWGCRPLAETIHRQRLETLCARIGFRHAGLLTWPVMRHSFTAAILGVIAPFRYVMFTQKLMEILTPEEVEAVLAHEIGHSRHHHLMLYPLILMGLAALVTVTGWIFEEPISLFFQLKQHAHPGAWWTVVRPIALITPYVVLVICYFRFLFGFFSRQFERQADLYIFQAEVPVEALVSAFDRIATAGGNIHHQPNWHHYSIQQRIDFLRAATSDPSLQTSHHRGVRKALFSYVGVLAVTALLAIAPLTSDTPVLTPIGQHVTAVSEKLGRLVTAPTREAIAKEILPPLFKSNPIIVETVEESLLAPQALSVTGLADFYAARELLSEGYTQASAYFFERAERTMDFGSMPPTFSDEWEDLHHQIERCLDEL